MARPVRTAESLAPLLGRDLLLAEAEQLLIDRGVVEKGDLIALTIGEPIDGHSL